MGTNYQLVNEKTPTLEELRERDRARAIRRAAVYGNAPVGHEPGDAPKSRGAYAPKAGPSSADIRSAYLEALSDLPADATLQEVCDLVVKRLRVTHKHVRNATAALRLDPKFRRDTASERLAATKAAVLSEARAILAAHPHATAQAKQDLYARLAGEHGLATETVAGWINGWTTRAERKRRQR